MTERSSVMLGHYPADRSRASVRWHFEDAVDLVAEVGWTDYRQAAVWVGQCAAVGLDPETASARQVSDAGGRSLRTCYRDLASFRVVVEAVCR